MLTKHHGRNRTTSREAMAGFYQTTPSNISIVINSAAAKMIGLNFTENYAVLYYDKSKSLVAIKFFSEREDGSLKVTTGKNRNATVSATSFIKANAIKVNNERHPLFRHEENGETYYAFSLENGK